MQHYKQHTHTHTRHIAWISWTNICSKVKDLQVGKFTKAALNLRPDERNSCYHEKVAIRHSPLHK